MFDVFSDSRHEGISGEINERVPTVNEELLEKPCALGLKQI